MRRRSECDALVLRGMNQLSHPPALLPLLFSQFYTFSPSLVGRLPYNKAVIIGLLVYLLVCYLATLYQLQKLRNLK